MAVLSLPATLPRRLGAISAAGTLVGIMVGSGIFRIPSAVAEAVPSPAGFMAVWLVGGLLALSGALMFAEFAAMYPDTGGRYVYLREGVHPVVAFAYAVGNIFMLRPVSLSARSLLIAAYLATLIPGLAGREIMTAAVIIITLSALNYRSALLGAGVATATSVAKVLALLLLAGLTLSAAPELPASTAAASGTVTLKGLGLALVTVMWTYSGWGSSTYITGEVRNAQRIMPRVLMLGVGAVVLLFLLINWAYLQALPMDAIAASDTVATDAAAVVLGPSAAKFMSVLVVVSVLGSLTGSMLAAPRLPFAMGNDAPRLRLLARVHQAYGTPHASVLFTAALALLYLGAGDFEQLVKNYILGSWPFYVLVAIGYFRLRRNRPDLPRPFRTPGYPLVPGFFLLAAAAMVLNGFVADPIGAITGSWVMLVGVPVYYLVRARAPGAIR